MTTEEFNKKQREYVKRIIDSKVRLLRDYPFYGILVANLQFQIDNSCSTAYTDGKVIAFSGEFLEQLQDYELDFILMHEVLHVALRHCFRHFKNEDHDVANIAADMVVNSIIMKNHHFNKKYEKIADQEVMHILPNGKEGHECTFEEAYHLCLKAYKKIVNDHASGDPENDMASSNSSGNDGQETDDDLNNGGQNSQNKKGKGDKNQPNNSKGDESESSNGEEDKEKGNNSNKSQGNKGVPKTIDSHDKWKDSAGDQMLEDLWASRVLSAAETVKAQKGVGCVPEFAERLLQEVIKDNLDWKSLLHRFIEEEVVDYSFCPPDRRMQDNPFFLPEFNDTSEKVENIYFFIDTSGSMSEDMIADCYSEIKAAIDQFGNRLKGYLGFFDAAVIPPKPFNDITEFKLIRAYGGGGTDFKCPFEYINQKVPESEKPKSIIMLTDGYASFPNESIANDVPVLWVLCTDDVNPPWGQVARIK